MLCRNMLGAGAVALALGGINIAAADEASSAADGGQGGGTGWQLDAISVTATRNPIESFDYPGMVTVIGREAIEDRQPSTPDDVLGTIPNVEFTGGPRRTGEVPSIRGFSGPDVVITVDGARQNFLSGHDGRFFIDPALLREAEVLRGPGSSLYGSGATGGVIALRTLRAEDLLAPGDTAGVRLRAGYQDVNEEWHSGVTAYGRAGEDTGLLASVVTRDSGTIQLGDDNELDNTDDDIVSGLFKGNFKPGEHSELELSFQRFDNDAREPNNGQGAGGDNSVDKDIRADTARARFAYNDPDNAWVDLDLTVYRTETFVDELRLDNNGLGPEGELLEREVETTGVRLDNRTRADWGDGVTFTYGLETYTDEQDGESASGDRPGVPDAEFDFNAVFGQAEFRWADLGGLPGELIVIPGIRFDDFEASSDLGDDLSDDEVSPRIGVTWKPTPATMLFASQADAFRAPTVGEIFQSGVHFQIPLGFPFGTVTNRFVSNPDLEPQRTETLEIGGGFELFDIVTDGDMLSVKLSRFEIDGEDFIDTEVNQPELFVECNPGIPGDCDGTTRAVNVNEAELWGEEIEASYRTERLRATLGYSRIDGENTETDEKLGVLTPKQLSLGLRYALPDLDATVGGRVLLADDFDQVNDPAEERDDYGVLDLFYTWQPTGAALRGTTVRVGVDNVLDEDYARTFTDATEPGRNFKASVGYNVSW